MTNENHYHYVFSNQEKHTMTPLEAHRYAHKHKIDILSGPNYRGGRQEESFKGWGWHSSLRRVFKGPNDYRSYLREHNLIEAGNERAPLLKEYEPPIWNDELIKKAVDLGIYIPGNLAAALKSGELDFPDQCNL